MKLLLILAGIVLLIAGCTQQTGTANQTLNSSPAAPPPPPNCSGGSANLSVAGTVQYNGSQFTDSCASNSSVEKFYCNGSQVESGINNCPQGSACQDGACIVVRQAQVQPAANCVSTTAGDDYYTAGSVTYDGTTYNDTCQGLYDLTKYSCGNDTLEQNAHHCQPGDRCQDGACVHMPRTCTDTNVQNNSVVGTATLLGGGVVVSEMQDSCINSTALTEYDCGNGSIVNSTVNCGEGYACNNGACFPLCAATATGVVVANGTEFSNNCTDNYTLEQYTCSGSSVTSQQIACDTYCEDGGCIPESALSCDITQNGAEIVYNNSTLLSENDSCSSYQAAEVYSCESGTCVNSLGNSYNCQKPDIVASTVTCNSSQVCQSGTCIAITQPACFVVSNGTAGDIGDNSSAVLTDGSTVTSVSNDYCIGTATLMQYYCGDDYIAHNEVTCPGNDICQDDACVYPYTCEQTTNRSATSAGAVTLYDGTTQVRTDADLCSGSTGIDEVGCYNGSIVYSVVPCPTGTGCNSETGTCG
jgi:hypothetical protein